MAVVEIKNITVLWLLLHPWDRVIILNYSLPRIRQWRTYLHFSFLYIGAVLHTDPGAKIWTEDGEVFFSLRQPAGPSRPKFCWTDTSRWSSRSRDTSRASNELWLFTKTPMRRSEELQVPRSNQTDGRSGALGMISLFSQDLLLVTVLMCNISLFWFTYKMFIGSALTVNRCANPFAQ